MGTSLTGLTPSTTYDALIKVGDNGPLSATAKVLSDGLGNDSILALSTTAVGIGTTTPTALLQVKGSGSTSATTSLLVQNSGGTASLTVLDNGSATISGVLTVAGFLNVNGAAQSVGGLNTTRLNASTDASIGFAGGAAASSVLECQSTTKGFLPPRMTTTQRNAIASPAEGLMIYNTTTAKLNVYTTAWEAITSL